MRTVSGFPRLWAKVHASGVRVWQARTIATATRHLSVEAAVAVDAAITPSVGLLLWGRLEHLLAAAVEAADPAQAPNRPGSTDTDRFLKQQRTIRPPLRLVRRPR